VGSSAFISWEIGISNCTPVLAFPELTVCLNCGIVAELEQWTVLCTQAAEEQDAAKFHELSRKIERMLQEKERRVLGISETSQKDEGS
jgi:hypothetical protein